MKSAVKILTTVATAVLFAAIVVLAVSIGPIGKEASAASTETSPVDRTFSYGEEMRGKSVVFLGDSITARYVNRLQFEDDDTVGPHYTQLLASEFGFYFANLAVSGAVWGGNENDIVAQIESKPAILASADYVSIFLGTNDYGFNRPLGSIASPATENSLYGSMKNGIEKIIAANPDAKIMLVTPIARYDGTTGGNRMSEDNTAGYNLSAAVDAVKVVAARYGCSVADISSLVGDDNRTAYLQRDNLHVTSAGYAAIAEALKNA